jgi:phosphoribosylaminoimidazole-succinocarboxamide synthase
MKTIDATDFSWLGKKYRGKVRDTYERGDRIFIVTTDRISAFDHILPRSIPHKGQVLNQLAAHFFGACADLIDNHVLSVPDPNITVGKRCTTVPIEFVVRGYLAGHAWREYKAGKRHVCGEALPDGLRESEQLPHPILTPATKASSGHDEDISAADIIASGILSANDLGYLRDVSLRLFERGTAMASEQNLILVDTKYEFGRDAEGNLLLIDEVHTPDSSRYYYADSYERNLAEGVPQRQLSKEFVREWLMSEGFQGLENQEMPEMTNAVVGMISSRYVELYEQVTGTSFIPDMHPAPLARMEDVLRSQMNLT